MSFVATLKGFDAHTHTVFLVGCAGSYSVDSKGRYMNVSSPLHIDNIVT